MRRILPITAGLVIVTAMVVVPAWYKHGYDRHNRGLHVVRDGVLYRSAQLDLEGLKCLVRDYGIRTIIDLRDGETAADKKEADWAQVMLLKHVRIPPRPWAANDGTIPAEQGLETFRKIMREPANYPVLVHCFGGVHRTGIYCAVYRMEFEGWDKTDAVTEMRTLGYSILDQHEDVLTFFSRLPNRVQPVAFR
jgi:protein tyrosine/serine phosphatase